MKAIKFFFGTVAVLVLLGLTAMLILITYLDSHKGILEDSVSSALGREIRIEDGVKLHWSMTPSITLAGVWIANPDWTRDKYLLRAERAYVQFDVKALLQRRLVIEQVTLENADIDFETAMDGQHNWHFGSSASITSKTRSDFEVIINAFEVKTSQLRFRSSHDQDYQLDIHRLEFFGVGSKELKLETEFRYQDMPFSVSATSAKSVSDRGALAAGRPFKGQLKTAGVNMNFSGHVQSPFALNDVEIDLHSDRLALSSVWPSSPVTGLFRQVSAQLNTSGTSPQLLLNNLDGNLAIDSANLTLPAKPGEPLKKVTLNKVNLSAKPDQPMRLQTSVEYANHVFELELAAGTLAELFAKDQPWQTFRLSAQGQFENKPLSIAGQFGPLSAVLAGRNLDIALTAHEQDLKAQVKGRLARFTELEGSRLDIDLSGHSLAQLTPWLGMDLPETSPFTLSSQLDGREFRLGLKRIKTSIRNSDISGELTGHIQSPFALSDVEIELHSELLDLSTVAPSSPVTGSFRKVTARFKTSGNSPQLLLNNLDGKLSSISANLTLPAKPGEPLKKVTLNNVNFSAKPDQPMRLQTSVEYAKHVFDLELAAGTLTELIAQDKPWQTIRLKAQGQFENKPLSIAGQFGPLSAVLAGRNLDIALTAHEQDLKAQVKGRLARFTELEGSRLDIDLSGPSLALLTPWLGETLPQSEPFTFTSLHSRP